MDTPEKHELVAPICSNFHNTIEFIGRRWMGVVVYSLMDGPKRFHEISANIPGISDRLLTERLNELIKEGLATKTQLVSSTKSEYKLTPKGLALKEVIAAIHNWTDQCRTL
ncbi:helix-turn-helix domain-containing protein [Planomicrobium sp. CPCC 101079]|uniref:winged helix-turn-helix transcriptional regulator n=1 Tax=Planomicrobium sp. CPCC 101079 TaxID=2599618 RepID=UPI0011B50429|nr:helix-turn-helix domain-containing protein [Planomicrobium sp. CPCC 101079]TWT13218.1 helix-turn-helix transcriptional regulator [Planomicrobium sp. CPCC 101079]